jgi:ABC-2 type transport system permease protein
VPDLLVFSTLSPIMFVLLFAYIFGSAIEVAGSNYREFLIAGIFAQTVVFGATITGSSMAEDLQKGVLDRFRSLPMSPSAVLVGRTAADVANNVITLVVMSLTGLVVGWRIHTGLLPAIRGYLLLLIFAYAVSWLMACVGMVVRTPEVVNNASFIVIFPLTFCANTFTPIDNFPAPLKVFAQWNPVSSVTLAAREAFGNTVAGAPQTAWPLQNPALYTVLWALVILVLFVPLAVAIYRRAASR